MTQERFVGTVKWWNQGLGYGFILCEGEEYFVHYSNLRGVGFRNLVDGERVEFSLVDNPRGPECVDVVVLDDTAH